MTAACPVFFLVDWVGAAQDFVRDHPALMRSLRNGFDESVNRAIAIEEDVKNLVQQVADQFGRLPVVRGRVAEGVSFRILALDGGGIKGAFSASVLATLSQTLHEPLSERFDLIAGTSDRRYSRNRFGNGTEGG